MRTYYLFWIKEEFFHAYFKNPKTLYQTFFHLYKGNISSYSFTLSFYKQICAFQKIDLLSSYLKGICYRCKKNNYMLICKKRKEKTIVTVRPSVLVMQSNKNIPLLFKTLPYYSSYLFVCDFETHDYFWLTRSFSRSFFTK